MMLLRRLDGWGRSKSAAEVHEEWVCVVHLVMVWARHKCV